MISKSSKNISPWLSLLFSSIRRQSLDKKLHFKDNIVKLRDLSLKTCTDTLAKEPDLNKVPIYAARNIYSIQLPLLQKMLLTDIILSSKKPASALEFVRVDKMSKTMKNRNIPNWELIAPLFMNPVSPTYREYKEDGDEGSTRYGGISFRLKQTIKLDGKGSKPISLHKVIWPDVIYSYCCRGIGVTEAKFNELDGFVKFINPSNGNRLPIFQVSFVPEGYDAVGLFPQFVEEHLKVFNETDQYKALILSEECLFKDARRIKDLINGEYPSNDRKHTFDDDTPEFNGDVLTLKKLYERTVSHKTLWSRRDAMDRRCPADIIRCVLLSNNATVSGIRSEYFKYHVLFNVYIHTLKLTGRLTMDLDGKLWLGRMDWKSWDLHIWKQYLELNKREGPSTIEGVIESKQIFDNFIKELYYYQCITTSEMISKREQFFESSRSILTSLILLNILQHSKWVHLLYPGLSLFMKMNLPPVMDAILDNSLRFPEGVAQEKLFSEGAKLYKIIGTMQSLENECYQNDFSTIRPIKIKDSTALKNWKMIIMTRVRLPKDITEVIKFNTRIYTQFVNTPEEVSQNAFTICVGKQMIDPDTFVYLFRLDSPEDLPSPPRKLIKDTITHLQRTI